MLRFALVVGGFYLLVAMIWRDTTKKPMGVPGPNRAPVSKKRKIDLSAKTGLQGGGCPFLKKNMVLTVHYFMSSF